MTTHQAKRILLTWRPSHGDALDPLVAEALDLAHNDDLLREWLDGHIAFQTAVTKRFRAIQVPAHLRESILSGTKMTAARSWWQRPAFWSVAAAVVLLLAMSARWWQPAPEDALPTFRSRMVSAVLRQYTMDIVTNDMTQVRAHLAAKQAPADYELPPGLARLPVTGAGVLSWQAERVSMVCLEATDRSTLFLFVVNTSTLHHPPTATREFAQVNKLTTVTWTAGGKTYVLAGSGGRAALEAAF